MTSKNHMSIPQARDRLRKLADELGIDELRDIADSMYRRRHKDRRAPVKSVTVTPYMRAAMRRYAKHHPDAANQDIANHFNVNIGRVSEAFERG